MLKEQGSPAPVPIGHTSEFRDHEGMEVINGEGKEYGKGSSGRYHDAVLSMKHHRVEANQENWFLATCREE